MPSRPTARSVVRALLGTACLGLALGGIGCARGLEVDDARTLRRDVQPGTDGNVELPVDDIGDLDAVLKPDDVQEVPDDAAPDVVISRDVPVMMGSDGGCAVDPARDCTPGDVAPCGTCGSQTCTSGCVWGACTGEGTCTAGRTQPCGRCGTQTCSAGCGWGACAGEGTCMPGQTRACGNCGTQTCTAACGWGACSGEGACAAGATRASTCDACSQQVCSASCQWSACQLRPGNTCEYRAGVNARSCSACSCGRQWCLSSCQWSTSCTSCCTTCGGCQ